MVVFMLGGFHVPLIPFVDVAGRAGAVEFWQSGPMGLKDGVVGGFTVTVAVAVGPGQLLRLGVIVYVTVPGVPPVVVNVWLIVAPDPFAKPLTPVPEAVQEKVAPVGEDVRLIGADRPEQMACIAGLALTVGL
jgi:hypothetical protein